jgi:hypothetical protein
MIQRLCLLMLFILFAMPVQAAWTDAERVELRKIVQTALIVQDIVHDFSPQIPKLANPRDAIPALSALVNMSWHLRSAFDCVAGVTGSSGCGAKGRPDQLVEMYKKMDSLREHQKNAVSRLKSLGYENFAKRLNVLPIDSFDRQLSYLHFRPEAYPNIVGAHGDFNLSMSTIQHTVEYMHHAQHDMLRLWQNTTGNASVISTAFAASGTAMQKLWRAYAINADIALADDTATALADSKHGTGLRPSSFFLALIAVEYTLGRNHVIFSGREAKRGATLEISVMMDRLTTYLTTLPPDQLAQQFASGSGHNFGARGTNSWARNFYLDVTDFWKTLDQWGANFTLFFRAPPAPPVQRSERISESLALARAQGLAAPAASNEKGCPASRTI